MTAPTGSTEVRPPAPPVPPPDPPLRLAPGGPAARAGVQQGDLVLGAGGMRTRGLAEFFRLVWRQGAAGVDVPLSLARAGDVLRVNVKSADRAAFLKKPDLH